jgi:hypothetical protein
MGTPGLEGHELFEAFGIIAFQNLVGFDVELLQLVQRQVDAPAKCIFTDVTNDVGELQGLTQLVSVKACLGLRLAEDVGCHFADDAGNQMAVALQARIVKVAGLLQIHLATFDDGLQVALFDLEVCCQGHQCLHDGVAGPASERLTDFGAPPGQFAAGYAQLLGFVDDIIDLAAKGVEGGDGGAPGRW